MSTSRVKPGCVVKRFGERHTFVKARTDDFGRRIWTVKRWIDGCEVEEWASDLVHSNTCPCRQIKETI